MAFGAGKPVLIGKQLRSRHDIPVMSQGILAISFQVRAAGGRRRWRGLSMARKMEAPKEGQRKRKHQTMGRRSFQICAVIVGFPRPRSSLMENGNKKE